MNSNGFVVNICIGVLIVRFRIGKVGSIVKACYLSKVDSIYQLGGLDYPRITGVTKAAILKSNL